MRPPSSSGASCQGLVARRRVRGAGIAGALLALVAAAGCGPAGNGDSGTTSCDYMDGTEHKCLEWVWSNGTLSAAQHDDWGQQCSDHMGSLGGGCSLTGSIGGCKTVMTLGLVLIETTQWYYSGNEAQAKAGCAGAGATWVTP